MAQNESHAAQEHNQQMQSAFRSELNAVKGACLDEMLIANSQLRQLRQKELQLEQVIKRLCETVKCEPAELISEVSSLVLAVGKPSKAAVKDKN